MLILFGKWKIKKGIGLVFELEYESKKIHAITFGAEARLTAKDSISFSLKSEQDEDLSSQLKLSRRMLKGDGLAFAEIRGGRYCHHRRRL